jgi:TatD DNase family protein
MKLVDAHAHLDRYGADVDSALAEIREVGVRTLAVSMDVPSYETTRALAAREPLVIAGFGIHPWNASPFARSLDLLLPFVEEASVVGEIGLDRHFVKDPSAYPAQREVFDFLLDAASRLGKAANLHTKGAEREVADRMAACPGARAIVHWYSGPLAEMDRLLDRGAYFTVGVALLRSRGIDEIARRIPSDRLLTETDNPGAWSSLTGKPGRPRLVLDVLERLAELRSVDRDELAGTIAANYDAAGRSGNAGEGRSTL